MWAPDPRPTALQSNQKKNPTLVYKKIWNNYSILQVIIDIRLLDIVILAYVSLIYSWYVSLNIWSVEQSKVVALIDESFLTSSDGSQINNSHKQHTGAMV